MNSGKFVQPAQASPDGASTLASTTPPNSSSIGQKKAIPAQARLSKKKPSLFARLFSCFSSSSKSAKNDNKRRYSGPETVMTAGARAKLATSSSVATNSSLAQDKPSPTSPNPHLQQPPQQSQQQQKRQPQEQQHLDTSQPLSEKPTETSSTAPSALFPSEAPPDHDIQHQPAASSPQPIIEEPEKGQYTINEHSNDYNEFDDDDDDDDDDYDDLSDSQQLVNQETDQHDYENAVSMSPPEDPFAGMYNEEGMPMSALGPNAALLMPQSTELEGRKLLVLDLDETLIHSSFKYVRKADFVIPVQIDAQYHNIYVIKRPGVDEFMRRVGELYEVVVFTASVSKYADPLLDQLDIHNVVHHRLFRESCYNHNGNFVKHLGVLGRPMEDVIIIDNTPTSYIFHPQHAVPVSSWFSDAHDNELLDMIPILEDLAAPEKVSDVSMILDVNLE
ncbi:hypothetical protein D0Z00_002993 [Geotrichum galactomycetum]|uniref:Uncharacterized protein n=1 Tax=Geotrichum galactomycetum TaxID=27317 RepID=A0ACB6V2H4_9ASCO|nr:hypothetical protein D0Z00_002993 [Geotrichum candidum]